MTTVGIAQGQCTLESIGELRTLPGAFDVNERYAFVELNGDLVAYDLSAPGTPLRVGQLAFDDYVSGIALAGDLAFVVSNGLRVVDISDPAAMHVVGVFETTDPSEQPSGAPLHWEGLVCVNSETGSLLIFDVADPSHPRLMSNTELGDEFGALTAFDAGRAYLLNVGELSIWDVVSEPSPVLVGEYDFGAWVGSFNVRGVRAYVHAPADPRGRILDISDPANIRLTGTIPDVQSSTLLAVDGDQLITFGSSGGHHAINVYGLSNPDAPQLLASVAGPEMYFGGIAAGGGNVLLSDGGIVVVNAQLAAIPRYAGHILETGGWIYEGSVAAENDVLFVGERYSELETYRLSDDGAIEILGHWRVPDFCIGSFCFPDRLTDVQVSNGFVYATAQHREGVFVIDASDPSRPTLALIFSADAQAVTVVDQRAYVLENSRFVIYSVENPRRPLLLGELPLDSAWRVWINSDRAYVSTPGNIVIIDIADPASPTVIGAIPSSPGPVYDLASFPPYVLIATGSDVSVFDTTDPAAPIAIPVIVSYEDVTSIEVRGSRAYVCANSGFRILDIADPARPGEIAECHNAGLSQGFVLQGGRALVLGHGVRVAVVPLASAGDADGDGRIELSDLAILLGNFSQFTDEGAAAGDFNCDGQVELDDLAVLLANFGQ